MNFYLFLAAPLALFPLVILLDFRRKIVAGLIYTAAFYLLLFVLLLTVYLTEKDYWWLLLPALLPMGLLLARWIMQRKK